MLAWSGSACFLHVSTTGPFPWVQDHKGRYCRPPLRHQPNFHTHTHTRKDRLSDLCDYCQFANKSIFRSTRQIRRALMSTTSLFLEALDKVRHASMSKISLRCLYHLSITPCTLCMYTMHVHYVGSLTFIHTWLYTLPHNKGIGLTTVLLCLPGLSYSTIHIWKSWTLRHV